MRLDDFLERIESLKAEYNIQLSYERSSNTVCKRIAILVNDCYLKWGGDLHWASVLERKIYEEVQGLNFICDPISYELNWEEVKRKAKDKKWNPLKLALDKSDKHLSYHPMIIYLCNQIIEILSKETEVTNEQTRESEDRGSHKRGPDGASFQMLEIDRLRLDQRERFAIHKAREQEVCLGTGPHGMDSK